MKIYHLPTCIFDLIQSYLILTDPYISTKQYLYLTSTTKEFSQIRKETVILYLRNKSNLFLEKKDVHQSILRKVLHPRKQLKVSVSDVWHLYQMISWLPDVIPFQYSTDYKPEEAYVIEAAADLNSVDQMIINLVADTSDLQGLQKVNPKTLTVQRNDFTVDLDVMIALNANNFTHLRKVEFIGCISFKDIQSLNFIHDLTFRYCHQIEDHEIQCLQHNHRICIDHCEGIHNYIQCFKYIKIIEIISSFSSPFPTIDFNSFESVTTLIVKQAVLEGEIGKKAIKKLHLKYVLGEMINFNLFTFLNDVTLDECTFVSEVTALGNVRRLRLIKLSNLRSLTGLGQSRQKIVTVSMLRNVSDFSPLNGIKVVIIDSCLQFMKTVEVNQVEQLKIINCAKIDDITPLCSCKSLTLENCGGITSLSGLLNVPVVYLAGTLSLRSASGLGNNEKIVIRGRSILNQCYDMTEILGDNYTLYPGFHSFEYLFLRKRN